MNAVKITSDGQTADVVRSAVETGSASSFVLQMQTGPLPAVYIVESSKLDALRQFNGAVVDRGVKDKRKGLGALLLGYEQVPIIEGSYTSAGQLRRGGISLLEQGTKKKDVNAYVVGASDDAFAALWSKADDASEEQLGGPETVAELLGRRLPRDVEPEGLVNLFQGRSSQMDVTRRLILRNGLHDYPVLILGEMGVGKRLAGRALRHYGNRSSKPYVEFNCATIGSDLLESELFGIDPPPGDDAKEPMPGAWETAGDGTLMLYGISELTLPHQRLVLRALQDKKIRRRNAPADTVVCAKVVAATTRDLHAMVEANQFRDDLYFLLRRSVIRIPALRDHPEDIETLAQRKWVRYAGAGARLPDKVIRELKRYGWPGNVSELKSVLSNLYTLFGDPQPTLEQFRGLMLYRQASAASIDSLPEHGAGLHWIDCVRHLQRVTDVLAACENGINEWMEGPDKSARAVTSAGADLKSIQRFVSELGELLDQPLLFQSWSTFKMVHDFHGCLMYLNSLLQTDSMSSRKFWKESVEGKFQPIMDEVGKELNRAVGES